LLGGPLLVAAAFAGVRRVVPGMGPARETLALAALLVALGAALQLLVARAARAQQERLAAQEAELLAVHAASVAVSSRLGLDDVLQTVVDEARGLLGARYGALAVIDEQLRPTAFLVSGVDPGLRRLMGAPTGKGLLGVVLHEGQRLRIDDIASDPRASGFPPGHPSMKTLLAVPLLCRRGHRGNLYVADRVDGRTFTAEDEAALARFALQAAIAVDNAVLHGEARELAATRERLRLAGRTYDAIAQLLAYVNTKAQVVREHCRRGDVAQATLHLDQLADTARDLFAQQRARLLDLRALEEGATSTVDAIAHHARAWEAETGVDVELELPPSIDATPDVELQLLRIVQEGLDNVWRHARAARVRLALEQDGGGLHLLLRDDGIGFDPVPQVDNAPNPRFGLAAMRERARAVGGLFVVDSVAGSGTTLRLDLPARSVEGLDASPHC
jgi:signal transduction histidine kinase